MRALILLVVVILVLALAGWISFSKSPDRSSINLETQQIQQDTDRALESGSNLLREAGEAVDRANESTSPSEPLSAPAQ
jgi:cytoskeletal protein RodZ